MSGEEAKEHKEVGGEEANLVLGEREARRAGWWEEEWWEARRRCTTPSPSSMQEASRVEVVENMAVES